MAGDSADLLLTGIDAAVLHQGCVLCHPDFPVRVAIKFTAQVLVLDVGLPLLKGHAVTIHAHTAREAGVVSHLVALCDGRTGAVTKQRPRCLLAGQVSGAEMVVREGGRNGSDAPCSDFQAAHVRWPWGHHALSKDTTEKWHPPGDLGTRAYAVQAQYQQPCGASWHALPMTAP